LTPGQAHTELNAGHGASQLKFGFRPFGRSHNATFRLPAGMRNQLWPKSEQMATGTDARQPQGQREPSHTKWLARWDTQRRIWSRQPLRHGATGIWSTSHVSVGRRNGRVDRNRRRSFNIPMVSAKFKV